MIHRLTVIFLLVPVAIVLIALAVANRTATPFTLDPFHPGNPLLTIEMPLFVWLFAAMLVGVVLGSFATWLRQGRYRREAKARKQARATSAPAVPTRN